MTHRHYQAFAYALLATGLTFGVLGILGDNDPIWRTGLFLVLPGVTLVAVGTLRGMHHATADEKSDMFNAGYQLCADHVARGLLNQPPAPTDSGHRAGCGEQASNVIPLRRTTHIPERQAL
ncbi:hypothetical protein [Streptomyces sp. NBC_01180]|uniref:hypothetical protein n=1 Tax=Streptomyces sp. NBC_01180 TaxID=2903763 RepID=UPI00386A7F13|nr:hypothetical protein OG708_17605 [Streptomyces sp. NBC_01180]